MKTAFVYRNLVTINNDDLHDFYYVIIVLMMLLFYLLYNAGVSVFYLLKNE